MLAEEEGQILLVTEVSTDAKLARRKETASRGYARLPVASIVGLLFLAAAPVTGGSLSPAPEDAAPDDNEDCHLLQVDMAHARTITGDIAGMPRSMTHVDLAQAVSLHEAGDLSPEKTIEYLRSLPGEPLPALEELFVNKSSLKDPAKATQWLKKWYSVPATDPMWTALRAQIKALSLNASQDVREWVTFTEKKDWEGYNKKSCAFEGGAKMIPEPGNASLRPADAFYCGHPAIDWNGDKFTGKPINDLCSATVGDASKPSLCGKYSDKEIVLGVTVGAGDIKADSRNVNVMTIDCLLDIVDADIYYCQKCAGRCHD